MKKKAFGIVLLVLAALILLQGKFLESLHSVGKFWPLLGIGFLPINQLELCCVVT